jgi:hypothetical protein
MPLLEAQQTTVEKKGDKNHLQESHINPLRGTMIFLRSSALTVIKNLLTKKTISIWV